MPTALIAGLPQSMVARIKALLQSCQLPDGWNVRFAAGSDARRPSVGYNALEDIVGHMSPQESPHIFGLTENRGERAEINRRLMPHFRVRWLDSLPFVRQSREIVEIVEAAVREEEQWRQRVLPQNEKHALVLPSIFSTSCRDGAYDVWGRAMCWGDEGLIVAAERLLARFVNVHRKRGQIFHDDRGLVWNHAGERHGGIPIPRNWKFSLKLPDSFHFDVAHENPKEYSISDATGVRHTASKGPHHHLNIDAHGYVR